MAGTGVFFGLSTTSNPTTIRINDLKKKTKCWDRTSVDGRGSTARILFREDTRDGENVKLIFVTNIFNFLIEYSHYIRFYLT